MIIFIIYYLGIFFLQLLGKPLVLIFFIIYFFKQEIKNILQALAKFFNGLNSMQLKSKDFTLLMTSPTVPKESKILLTKKFIDKEENYRLLKLLEDIKNYLLGVQNRLKTSNRLYPAQRNDFILLKHSLIELRNRLEVLPLLDNDINNELQKIIDLLGKELSTIEQQNHPISEAMELFDSKYFDKKPEDFDLIIKIRKKILDAIDE